VEIPQISRSWPAGCEWADGGLTRVCGDPVWCDGRERVVFGVRARRKVPKEVGLPKEVASRPGFRSWPSVRTRLAVSEWVAMHEGREGRSNAITRW